MKTLDRGEIYFQKPDDLEWKPSMFAKGLSVKDIAIAGGLEMQFVRMEAGAVIPLHTHELPEFIYVLEGELMIAGRKLNAGCVSIAAPGSEHIDVHTINGCTFLLVDKPV